MMEPPPAAALKVIESQFIFQFLIVAFDPPAQHGELDELRAGAGDGNVESQYLIGAASVCGHSITSHSSGRGFERDSSRWAGRTRTAAKRERMAPRFRGATSRCATRRPADAEPRRPR
jgi:hypothetical protein